MKINYNIASEMEKNLSDQNDDTNIQMAFAIDNLNKAASMLDMLKYSEASEVITQVIESLSYKLTK